jgi:hypothetical protein
VSPGRSPPSVSALRTHLRSVSDETPNFSAIDVIAALRGVLVLVLEHHPNGALPQLLRIPARSCHGSNLSRVGASTKRGAVQRAAAVELRRPSILRCGVVVCADGPNAWRCMSIKA